MGLTHRRDIRRSVDGTGCVLLRFVKSNHEAEKVMGKYFLGWLLGVPVIVLVVIYLVMH